MQCDFSFRTVEGKKSLADFLDYLHLQDLGYVNYHNWVQKTEAEMLSGYKTGIYCKSNNVIVGNIIFQPHKTLPRVREIKNMRVHPDLRGNYIARFVLNQAEKGLGKDFDLLMCDIPETEKATIRFMQSCNFNPIGLLPLYSDSRSDVVMTKSKK